MGYFEFGAMTVTVAMSILIRLSINEQPNIRWVCPKEERPCNTDAKEEMNIWKNEIPETDPT